MTNTLHRQGSKEELKEDYVIFATTARGITRDGSAPKIKEFLRICLKHNPINIGSSKLGNILQDDIGMHDLIDSIQDGAGAGAVYTNLDTLKNVMSDLIKADLRISINVSGLLDSVQECCHGNRIERHSVEHSLGFWGSLDRLPEREVLAINTLCGHGMVSFNLIRKMMEYVKMRRLTPREAAKIMGKCCECAVFNTTRAEHLLEKVLET